LIRLCIVHEQRMLADLMASALCLEPRIQVIGRVCTCKDAVTVSQLAPCDVLLVSSTLPNNGAVVLTQALQKYKPTIKVLVTGLLASNTLIVHYLEQGLSGYVLEEDSYAVLVQKIRMALREECLLSPALLQALLARFWQLKQHVRELYALQGQNPTVLYATLTAREREVLGLLEQGYTNLQIGEALSIEPGTVKNHVHNLLDKLDMRTRKQAASLARQVFAPQATQRSPQVMPSIGREERRLPGIMACSG